MKMTQPHNLWARCLSLFLAISHTTAFAGALDPTPQFEIHPKVDTRAIPGAKPEYAATLSEMLKALGAKKVNCISGYRSPEQQRQACIRVCGNPEGCPSRCARPGSSQHQRTNVATCDLAGMPSDSCWKLKKLCDEKFDGKCGIGGYPSGGYHFGVNDYRFSAWNRCAALPRPKGNYPANWTPPQDPSPGVAGGSELDAAELSNNHELIWVAAVAAAGVGGALLYKKLRKK